MMSSFAKKNIPWLKTRKLFRDSENKCMKLYHCYYSLKGLLSHCRNSWEGRGVGENLKKMHVYSCRHIYKKKNQTIMLFNSNSLFPLFFFLLFCFVSLLFLFTIIQKKGEGGELIKCWFIFCCFLNKISAMLHNIKVHVFRNIFTFKVSKGF